MVEKCRFMFNVYIHTYIMVFNYLKFFIVGGKLMILRIQILRAYKQIKLVG